VSVNGIAIFLLEAQDGKGVGQKRKKVSVNGIAIFLLEAQDAAKRKRCRSRKGVGQWYCQEKVSVNGIAIFLLEAAGIHTVGQLPQRRIRVGLEHRGAIAPFPQSPKLIVLVRDDRAVEVGLGQQSRRLVVTEVFRRRQRQRALRAPPQAVQRETRLAA
jgi:hypothetical protein